MLFSLNYSDIAAELHRQGAIAVDCWKCAEFPEMVAAAKKLGPVYVHFPINVGRADFDIDLDALAALRDDTHTPLVNAHLAPYAKEYAGISDDDPALLIDRTLEQLSVLTQRFGHDQVMLESVMYQDSKGRFFRPAVEPKIISQIVRQANIGFLFDLSHARLAAMQTGQNEKEYISALPLDRMKELHITGLGTRDHLQIDHMPMTEEDWRWAQFACDQIGAGAWPKPWCAALEYGGTGPAFLWRTDANVIRTQVPRLYDMVKKVS